MILSVKFYMKMEMGSHVKRFTVKKKIKLTGTVIFSFNLGLTGYTVARKIMFGESPQKFRIHISLTFVVKVRLTGKNILTLTYEDIPPNKILHISIFLEAKSFFLLTDE